MTDAEWLLAGVDKVWQPVATPLGITLALWVTGHVLLTKRDVPASIGWIGLSVIAPVWGAALYFMFGINRVVRRANKARRGRAPRHTGSSEPAYEFPRHLRPLDTAVRRITLRTAEQGNAVLTLQNGDEAYPAMLAAIDAAQASIALSTYIMHDDVVGQRFVAALEAAKARGVEVRVLLDGVGSGYFSAAGRRLSRAGLPVALFMHSVVPWRMPFLNLRSHKKLLIVDGAVGFTGGINISDDNIIGAHPDQPRSDMHFRLSGPVVAQLMDAFAKDWGFTTGEWLDGAIWFPRLTPDGDIVARVITSGPDQDLDKIQSVMLEAIACAEDAIRLMTPYFLPGEELINALGLAAMRGVKVDVILPERSDHRFVDLAMRAHVGPLLAQGVRLWFQPPPFAHAKVMVVDSEWVLVGSSNWDMRSLRLNFELNVELYNRPLAERLSALMRQRQHQRLRLRDLNARSLPVRLRDAALRLLLPYI